jgi:hypothetical protein
MIFLSVNSWSFLDQSRLDSAWDKEVTLKEGGK